MAAKDCKLPAGIKESSDSDESILEEMCLANGIDFNHLKQGGRSRVKKLEMFFFGCGHIPKGMHLFQSLTCLCIISQQFDRIRGLESCSLLEELWICETQVQKIDELFHCPWLVRLYLYGNLISKIQGLYTLTKLEKLWLSGNSITVIEGLEKLCSLKELDLSCNQISDIRSSLDQLSQLEVLNLSGNKITSLDEIVHLASRPSLKSLCLCHPMAPPNPVCCLCNYSTYLLYHLPGLCCLDGQEVGLPELHKLVRSLVERKVQYYRMAQHHRQVSVQQSKRQLQRMLNSDLKTSCLKLKRASKSLKMLKLSSGSAEQLKMLSIHAQAISNYITRARQQVENACRAMDRELEQRYQCDLTELRSGGNVALTCCPPSQACFKACSQLVCSHFSERHYAEVKVLHNVDISGIEVVGVTRLENRLLYNSFNEEVKLLLGMKPCSSMTSKQLSKRMVHYLLVVWQPGSRSVHEVARDGFPPAAPPTLPYLWLTNGVYQADHLRLAQVQTLAAAQYMELVLCKVFTGQSVELSGMSDWPTRSSETDVPVVYKMLHEPGSQEPNTDFYQCDWFIYNHKLVLPEYAIKVKYLSAAFHGDVHMCGGPCLPGEVDISKLGKACSSPAPHYSMMDESTLLRHTAQDSLASIQHIDLHNNCLTRFRLAASLPQLTTLILCANDLITTEDFTNLPNLEVLDVSFNRLASLRGLKAIPKLKSLDLSWNCLTDYCEDLAIVCKHCPMLEVLDTRHNPWQYHEHLRDFVTSRLSGVLRTIDGSVSQEEIDGSAVTQEGVDSSAVSQEGIDGSAVTQEGIDSSAVTQEGVDGSAVSQEGIDSSVVTQEGVGGSAISQEGIDGSAISQEGIDSSAVSQEGVDGSAVSQERVSTSKNSSKSSSWPSVTSLLARASYVVHPAPRLSLLPLAHTLLQTLPLPPQSPSQLPPHPHRSPPHHLGDAYWSEKVTALCLSDLHLCKVTFLRQFPNLRWLSLANNTLTSIEGVVQADKLEEVTLDNNLIESLEGIGQLTRLNWLSVCCNRLATLPSCLEGLPKLCYFNASQNSLSTLQELESMSALSELYLSANQISKSSDLLALKALTSLLVLDLSFNPVATTETYRLFIIFHLDFLKALDGSIIESCEVLAAKEKLGGWLTQDYIFQKYPSLKLCDLVKLDLPSAGLKHVDLTPLQSLTRLVSLNLENNCLASFSGLVHLNCLKVLCLNHNRVEHLLPSTCTREASRCYLQHLQVLHLACNGIANLPQLHLECLPSLQALFLQGNDISHVEGLEGLYNLIELVLDCNKIKALQEHSLDGLHNLKELHLEENRLKSLSHISCLQLERLYLGLNRIYDFTELEKLKNLQRIVELSIINNPVSRRLQHRLVLVHQHPSLLALDGTLVTSEEAQVADDAYCVEEREMDFSVNYIGPNTLAQTYSCINSATSNVSSKVHAVPTVPKLSSTTSTL